MKNAAKCVFARYRSCPYSRERAVEALGSDAHRGAVWRMCGAAQIRVFFGVKVETQRNIRKGDGVYPRLQKEEATSYKGGRMNRNGILRHAAMPRRTWTFATVGLEVAARGCAWRGQSCEYADERPSRRSPGCAQNCGRFVGVRPNNVSIGG